MAVKCRDCAFWQGKEGGLVGLCKRKAPDPVRLDLTSTFVPANATSVLWPATKHHDTCGEGKPALFLPQRLCCGLVHGWQTFVRELKDFLFAIWHA